jgi:hypothetical protein
MVSALSTLRVRLKNMPEHGYKDGEAEQVERSLE